MCRSMEFCFQTQIEHDVPVIIWPRQRQTCQILWILQMNESLVLYLDRRVHTKCAKKRLGATKKLTVSSKRDTFKVSFYQEEIIEKPFHNVSNVFSCRNHIRHDDCFYYHILTDLHYIFFFLSLQNTNNIKENVWRFYNLAGCSLRHRWFVSQVFWSIHPMMCTMFTMCDWVFFSSFSFNLNRKSVSILPPESMLTSTILGSLGRTSNRVNAIEHRFDNLLQFSIDSFVVSA